MDEREALYEAAAAFLCSPRPDAARLFARGTLVRLRRGAYVPTDLWVQLDAGARFHLSAAAHAWWVPTAVFCGETSLFLRGLPIVKTPVTMDVAIASNAQLGVRPRTFEVRGDTELARRARALAPPPLRRHRHSPTLVEAVGTLPCLRVSESLAEVLGSAKFARALTVADGVLRQNPSVPLLDRPDIIESIGNLTFGTQRERARARAMLARAGAESPGESVSRALMLLWGFPEPVLQRKYSDSRGLVARTDFTWELGPGSPQTPLGKDRLGEFDGWGKYFTAELTGGEDPASVVKREKQRENRLIALGHPVVRWDWADLERPAQLRAKLTSCGLEPVRSAALGRKCA